MPDEPLALQPVDEVVLGPRGPGLGLYGRALWLAARRPQGTFPGGAAFPDLTVRRHGVRLGAARVEAYRRVCHHPGPGHEVPVALPEVLFFDLLGTLATHEAFPVSPFGLIHVGQTLTAHRGLAPDDALDLSARLAAVHRGWRGLTLSVRLEASRRGRRMWEGTVSLLSRSAAARSGPRRHAPREAVPPGPHARILDVPEATGRRYARVSDDHNPHHLWAWSARPLGYRRPIAHGMWTLGRALAELPVRWRTAPVAVQATFRKPLPMPSQVALQVDPRPDRTVGFAVTRPADRSRVHLTGTARPL